MRRIDWKGLSVDLEIIMIHRFRSFEEAILRGMDGFGNWGIKIEVRKLETNDFFKLFSSKSVNFLKMEKVNIFTPIFFCLLTR